MLAPSDGVQLEQTISIVLHRTSGWQMAAFRYKLTEVASTATSVMEAFDCAVLVANEDIKTDRSMCIKQRTRRCYRNAFCLNIHVELDTLCRDVWSTVDDSSVRFLDLVSTELSAQLLGCT